MGMPTNRAPTRPGEMLTEEFLRPLQLSLSELARRLGLSFTTINEIVKGKRPITQDTARRLGRSALGT